MSKLTTKNTAAKNTAAHGLVLWGSLLWALLAPVGLAVSQEPVGELAPIAGERQQAALQSVQDDGQLTFLIDSRPHKLAAAELVMWGRPADPTGQSRIGATDAAQIALADGGLIVADVIDCNGDDLIAESAILGQLKLPLDKISCVVLRPPADPLRRDERLEVLRVQQQAKDNDGVLLENGDVLWGTLKTIQGGKIEFLARGATTTIDAAKVSAFSINAALQSKTPIRGLRTIVGLADGSRLIASSLEITDEKAQIETAAGTWPTERKKIVFLQTLGGKAKYLSDFKAADYRHIPYLSVPWKYTVDRNVLGLPLRSGGRQYFKGIGMHSTSRLTFDLDAPYRRLEGTIALDDMVGNGGSVTFRVFADAKEVYKSGTVAGCVPKGKSGEQISVDISGAQRISLVVDFGERGDVLDRADWLDMRVVK